ncbi:hypothetical protein [Acaryochloris sp. IP29b_bin.137]|uniref:hypothetical protein n=1 Tax=Acaryochloris sp. IP29b_bin.137 TaxID=2969217 RepID=UPI002634C44C|nr:hypothetical protein [Acaryochloris sp. IP29b_bin.137]
MNHKTGGIDEISVLKKQLAISLKFHHSETLKKLPLDVAVQIMASVWDSCHPDVSTDEFSHAATAVIPQKDGARSIQSVTL